MYEYIYIYIELGQLEHLNKLIINTTIIITLIILILIMFGREKEWFCKW